jgi:hypothetical protein
VGSNTTLIKSSTIKPPTITTQNSLRTSLSGHYLVVLLDINPNQKKVLPVKLAWLKESSERRASVEMHSR